MNGILPKGRIVVAIRTEGITLAARPGGPGQQFKVVERALKLLVDSDVPVLRQIVRLIAMGAVEPRWLRLDVLHVAPALTASAYKTTLWFWTWISDARVLRIPV